QLAQKEYDQAVSTLNGESAESFAATGAELKCDIYTVQRDVCQARTAFQAAADAGGFEYFPLLQINLDVLAVTSPAA
ncbi:hypothetical protein CWB85_22250, partial [Pseudoalteromonas sp. S1727]|uniref:tetratricopeptide repeat protein n=1 Tax=Pseudoalteromonas sp. S1727 TaxID=2066514 RepID=UPI0011098865